jgi:hypothetical protein
MSKSIVWPIPAEHIEELLRIKHNLESPCSIWAAGFDTVGMQVCMVAEVEDADAEKLLSADSSMHEFEESDLIQ